MKKDIIKNDIIDKLHKMFGLCGHCGKRDCSGKKEYSKLPHELNTNMVLSAIRQAFNKKGV